ncbi:hypothetical protein [Thermogutta sp.]|uniref:hypothetical protein n=1 Tax=Thermogutta sp. TaxID=1962930 RepID=UPI0032200974
MRLCVRYDRLVRWICGLIGTLLLAVWAAGVAYGELPPIEKVELGTNRALRVNGKPFLPIMAWLQNPSNFSLVKKCGMNTVAGYWPRAGGTQNVAEYLELVKAADLYGVMPYDPAIKDHPALLGYIHDDEPDLPHQESSADVQPGPGLRLNPKTPLWRMVDGDESSWSVLDPLENAEWTIRLQSPVTVSQLAFWLTVSPGLSVATEIALLDGDREVARFNLEAKRGKQEFALSEPLTAKAFRFRIVRIERGQNEWGSISEVAAYDAEGKNVFLSPPRLVPRQWPERTKEVYQKIKLADPSRPVFMTFTGYFHPHFGKWSDQERQLLYPAYIEATDVVGFDIYPIYGWNKPEWIHLVYEATAQLTEMAGQRPVYAWIETSKGGQYTGPLENQKEVTGRHIRAEVWMALCGGATAIGYFTHVWKPAYSQFGVPEENQRALKEINDQLTRLAPAILATRETEKLRMEVPEKARLAAFLTRHEGFAYIFAVNYDPEEKPMAARFILSDLPGLASGSVEVVDEERSLLLSNSQFVDSFGPLAVHIYRIRLE